MNCERWRERDHFCFLVRIIKLINKVMKLFWSCVHDTSTNETPAAASWTRTHLVWVHSKATKSLKWELCVCYRGTHTLENRKLLLLSSRIITSLLVQIPGVSSNNSSISLKGVKTVICYWFIQATTTGRTIKNIPTRWQQIVIKNSKRDSVLLKIFLQILWVYQGSFQLNRAKCHTGLSREYYPALVQSLLWYAQAPPLPYKKRKAEVAVDTVWFSAASLRTNNCQFQFHSIC